MDRTFEAYVEEEFQIWQSHVPHLYRFVVSHLLEWPSLTVQWLPTRRSDRYHDASLYEVVVGTQAVPSQFTPTPTNYLAVLEIVIPDDPNDESELPEPSVVLRQKIAHEGEVHRVRCMPQLPHIIASQSSVSFHNVIYDANSTQQDSDITPCPQMTLRGATKAGFGLEWNPNNIGLLAAGSDDAGVRIWNAFRDNQLSGIEQPTHTLKGHNDAVSDVAWHPHEENLLFSVGEDKEMHLWDLRQAAKSMGKAECDSVLLAVDCNPYSQYLVATGGEGGLHFWDTRRLRKPVHRIADAHEKECTGVQWSMFHESTLMTQGGDNRVAVWDFSRLNVKQTDEDQADGPPELMFIHGGHTARVSEAAWLPLVDEEWTVASVAEDNVLQIWKPMESVVRESNPILPKI